MEIFTYGSVGGAASNRCLYPENRLEMQRWRELKKRADLDLFYFGENTIYLYLNNNTRVETFRPEMLPHVLDYAPHKRELVFVGLGKFLLSTFTDDETFLRIVEQTKTFFKQHGFHWIAFAAEYYEGFEPYQEWGDDGIFINRRHPPTESADIVISPQREGQLHVHYGARYARDDTVVREEELPSLLATISINKQLGVIYLSEETLGWEPKQFQQTVTQLKNYLELQLFTQVIVYWDNMGICF